MFSSPPGDGSVFPFLSLSSPPSSFPLPPPSSHLPTLVTLRPKRGGPRDPLNLVLASSRFFRFLSSPW